MRAGPALTSLKQNEYVAVAPPATHPHTITKELREAIRSAWKNKCAYCRSGPVEHVDHVFPKSRGGADCLANYVGSCGSCNTRKSDHILPDTLLVFLMEDARRKVPAVKQALENILAQAAGSSKPARKPVSGWHDVRLPFTRTQVAELISLDALHEGSIPFTALSEELHFGIFKAEAHGVADGDYADRLRFIISETRLSVTQELMHLLMMSLSCSSNQFRIRTKKDWLPSRSEIEKDKLCQKYMPIVFDAPLCQYEVARTLKVLEKSYDGNSFRLCDRSADFVNDMARKIEINFGAYTLGSYVPFRVIERRKPLHGGRWDPRVEMTINPVFVPLLKRSLTSLSPSFISFLDLQAGPVPQLADLPSIKIRASLEEGINQSWRQDWHLLAGVSHEEILSEKTAKISFEPVSESCEHLAA